MSLHDDFVSTVQPSFAFRNSCSRGSGPDFIRRFYSEPAEMQIIILPTTNQQLPDPQSLAAKLQLHVEESRELGQTLPSCTIDRRDSRQRVTTTAAAILHRTISRKFL